MADEIKEAEKVAEELKPVEVKVVAGAVILSENETLFAEYRAEAPIIKKNMTFADYCINKKLDQLLKKLK